MYERDTIAAIATPLGQGGVAIVRVSGPLAETITRQVFIPARQAEQLHSHHLYLGRVVDPCTGQPLDQGLLTIMRAPHSYTGEDSAEIHCHGGGFLARRILTAILSQGARLASPGEFTKRAFLNGRLDLSQAEAVLDLIQAKSEQGLHLAWEQLSGRCSQVCDSIRERLIALTAYVEAFIDFPEEDIPERAQQELSQDLADLIADITALGATFTQGKVYRDGVRTVIVGKPNVGKSSLLNLLVGTERAIVTAVPGTTRDILEEAVVVGGVPLVLWDTAGLRLATDEVERIGVERAQAGVKEAELVLAVFDASRPLDREDEVVFAAIAQKRVVPILNKVDLPLALELPVLEHYLHSTPLSLSVKNGRGFETLVARIQETVLGNSPVAAEANGVIISHVRHKDALFKAEQSLKNAQASLGAGLPFDLLAVDLRTALDHIGEITGHVTSEDILDHVFREFCIGK